MELHDVQASAACDPRDQRRLLRSEDADSAHPVTGRVEHLGATLRLEQTGTAGEDDTSELGAESASLLGVRWPN